MKIVVIDGQGGKVGKEIIEQIKLSKYPDEIYAIGTNSIATSMMLKAGADYGATGENAVIVNSRDADIIIGPIGIVLANSMLGEVTPQMAVAVGESKAHKILLPVNKCNTYIVGVEKTNITEVISQAIKTVFAYIE